MAANNTNWIGAFDSFISDIRISSKESNTIDPRGSPLVLWESQRRFLRELGEGLNKGIHKFNFLKSRQLGVTTISLALVDVFWLAMHPNTIACLVTDTEKNSNANRLLIEHYVRSFPEGYFGNDFRIVKANRKQIIFSNGSRIDLLVAGVKKKSTAWGEGVGYSVAHLTEVASYADVDGLKSLEEGFAQENPSRLFVYESTAKGMNHWRTRWLAGAESLTERSVFIGWWSGDTNRLLKKDPRFSRYGTVPISRDEAVLMRKVAQEYGHAVTTEQLAWIRWKESDAGSEQDLLVQNQPWTAEQAFVQTGYSFFQARVIGQDKQRIMDDAASGDPFIIFKGYRYIVDGDFFEFTMEECDPETTDIKDVELKVWEEPVPEGEYVIGFDPAYGRNDHKDHHCIEVFRCYADKIVQVAEYTTADVETKHAAWVLFHLCAAYGNTMANVELGGPGRLVMAEFDHLRQLLKAEMNADKTRDRDWEDAASQARWYLYHKVDSPGAGYMANFETNWRTKMELMHSMRGAYMSREFIINSFPLLSEMELVVVVDDKIGAPESSDEDKKDDRVFATALANRAWQEWVRKSMIARGLTHDIVMRNENGLDPPHVKSMNNIVYRFLAGANVEQEHDDRPKYLVDRGLA